jgi:hypothetical protein
MVKDRESEGKEERARFSSRSVMMGDRQWKNDTQRSLAEGTERERGREGGREGERKREVSSLTHPFPLLGDSAEVSPKERIESLGEKTKQLGKR